MTKELISWHTEVSEDRLNSEVHKNENSRFKYYLYIPKGNTINIEGQNTNWIQ